jgi:hypothetical protein
VVEVAERERGISTEDVKWMQLISERASLKAGKVSMLSGGDDGLGGGLSCPEKDRCTKYCTGGLSTCFQGVDKWFP